MHAAGMLCCSRPIRGGAARPDQLIDTTYAVGVFFACGSMVLSILLFSVFALCERKNRKPKKKI
jgi:hypothetical protein